MLSKPEVSVIVCHHVGSFIHGFIDSVLKSEAVNFEVIVVTSDESLIVKEDSRIITLISKELPASKRNLGSLYAKGKYLAFFDDDTEIESDCLFQMLEHVKAVSIDMVYGKLYKADEQTRFDEAGGFMTWTGFIWSRAGQNIIDTGQFDEITKILAGKSASCMVKKSAFEDVGGFDESFGILGEETDLSWRLWLRGYKVWFLPYAVGIHYFNTKFKPEKKFYTSDRVHFNGCRNYITMLLKNLGKEHLWIVPIHSLIWFFAGLAMIITGKQKQGWNVWRGLWYVVSHRKEILNKRGQIQTTRRISEAQLWPIISANTPRGYYWGRFTRYVSSGLHG